MLQLSTLDIPSASPMLYFPGAPAWPEEYKGNMQMEKLMHNPINNIEKQGIKNGEEIAGLNLRVGKVELNIVRIDGHLLRIDENLVSIDKKLDQIDQQFEKIDKRFDKMEDHLGKIDVALVTIKGMFPEVMAKQYQCHQKQTQWVTGMILVLVGVMLTALRYLR